MSHGILRIQRFHFNLCKELLESGEGQCNGVNEYDDKYRVKQGSLVETPYFHGAFPNENSWIFYWYTGVDENFEIDITFEK